MDTILLGGIGNPIVGDDGIGVQVVREIGRRIRSDRVVCMELTTSAIDILSTIAGYREAILVDAACTGDDPPGSLKRISIQGLDTPRPALSLHSVTLLSALQQGSLWGFSMPQPLTLFTIEGRETDTFHEGCSPEVQAALPSVIDRILIFVERRATRLRRLPPKDTSGFTVSHPRSQR
jgi:hydrogenase maturation protease